MKKYIVSFNGGYAETDDISCFDYAYYYVETANVDPKEESILKRCSIGSQRENEHLGNIFRENKVLINPYYKKQSKSAFH
ncbi:hypothetical protein OBV_p-00110 (plasmid) [Oscillibacter valericigenes Sjm18-20]|nr:hypothetical protein OBV_p-00110 [Oscillibacter valericigenes Sjm18-20]